MPSEVCPKCQFANPAGSQECGRCGVIFAKLEAARTKPPARTPAKRRPSAAKEDKPRASQTETDWTETVWAERLLLGSREEVNPFEIFGRAAALLLFFVWGIGFLACSIETGEINDTFMHLVNLVFHEAGHIFFSLLGNFMAVLGGTLLQLIMPLLCFLTFVFKYKNAFGGAATLWWLGHSHLDVAPYAYDAREQGLMLLGGVTGRDVPGYHDWNNLLGELGWLKHDHTIGWMFAVVGAVMLVAGLAWGLFIVVYQVRVWLRGQEVPR